VSTYAHELYSSLDDQDLEALYYKDLEFEDIFDEELTSGDRCELNRLIKAWGDRVFN
jgi:hypothetical protein